MTKKQQLQQEIFNLKAQAKSILGKEGVTKEELEAIQNNIQVAQAKLNLLEETETEVINTPVARAGTVITGNNGEVKVDARVRYEEALFNAIKGKPTSEDIAILSDARAQLGSEIKTDGGYLIPIDQQVEINELKREFIALSSFVTLEPVGTLSGTRVLEKDAEHVPFAVVGEGKAISASSSPQFESISYKIVKYGGILPIPNELLVDSNAKLRNYLNKWLSKKSIATENALIISVLETLKKKVIKGIDDIKDILDKDLDPAIASMSIILLNQNSFNYFNKLKDSQGNYLLEKDPKNITKKLLGGRPVVVVSNRTLKNKGTKAPVIIGSLKEAIVLFDRQAISLLSTNTGGDTFANDRTDIRAIMRMDIQKFDFDAAIYGEIDLSAVAPPKA